MSSFEGSLDESAAPLTEENAELLAATLLPAASTEDEELSCPCQKAYEESGNEKKVLYLMCIGLQCNDVPLFSFETVPWSLLPKTTLRPKNMDYCKEIARRATLFNITPIPRPSNWTRQQTIEWLEQNPVCDNVEIEFLTNEVARLRDVLVRAQQHQETSSDLAATSTNTPPTIGAGRWRGTVPYLRVIMCFTQDQVKALFLTRADAQTRQELDARNNESRPKTVFEVISELWNSPEFNPIAPASDCHVDYTSATNCSYEQVAALSAATPQKIQDIFASIRSDLLRIISRWEQSGQGEGGIDQEDHENHDAAEFLSCASSSDSDDAGDEGQGEGQKRGRQRYPHGSLDGRPARALHTRAAFLNGRPSYLLYFWEVADRHQLLQSSLQRLSDGVGASDASCAGVSTSSRGSSRKRKRRQQQDDNNEDSTLLPLVQSIQELADCQRQLLNDRDEDRNHEQRMNQERESRTMREQHRERIFRRKAELTDTARLYRKLNAELDPSNEQSARLSAFYVSECRQIEAEIQSLEFDNL